MSLSGCRRSILAQPSLVGRLGTHQRYTIEELYGFTEELNTDRESAQWRLLVSLWRYAGLRKMEVFGLKCNDVLWSQGKLRVHAPKTKRHEGRDVRYVPTRDIQKYLDAVDGATESCTVSIITRHTESHSNLDKPFKVILGNAGVVPCPKLFQNMRASCETDWLNESPRSCCCGVDRALSQGSTSELRTNHSGAFRLIQCCGAGTEARRKKWLRM
jgi:integrase